MNLWKQKEWQPSCTQVITQKLIFARHDLSSMHWREKWNRNLNISNSRKWLNWYKCQNGQLWLYLFEDWWLNCSGYKITINCAAKLDTYPLPQVDDLCATLSGGCSFTKLDMAQAYQQIPLEESSMQYVTINTHKGLYRCTCLPLGVSAAPAIYQRTMENLS